MYKATLEDVVIRKRYSRTHMREMSYIFGTVVESSTYKKVTSLEQQLF